MNLLLKITFLIIAHSIFVDHSAVNSANVNCQFTSTYFIDAATLYTCYVRNKEIFDSSRIRVESIDGNHKTNKSNDDVQALYMSSTTGLKFMPENFESFFKNIILIDISYTRLQELHQSDLQPFPKLKYLILHEAGSVEIIEKDLFKFNPDMEMIWLYGNKISHIDPNVFDNLAKLSKLELTYNDCRIFFNYAKTRSDVEKYITRVKKGDCASDELLPSNSTILNIRKNVQTISDLQTKVFEDQKTLDEITAVFLKRKNELSKRIDANEQTINTLNKRNKVLMASLND